MIGRSEDGVGGSCGKTCLELSLHLSSGGTGRVRNVSC